MRNRGILKNVGKNISESALKSAIQRDITLMSGFSIGKLVGTSNSAESMSDFSYEIPNRHTLPDDCRTAWKWG